MVIYVISDLYNASGCLNRLDRTGSPAIYRCKSAALSPQLRSCICTPSNRYPHGNLNLMRPCSRREDTACGSAPLARDDDVTRSVTNSTQPLMSHAPLGAGTSSDSLAADLMVSNFTEFIKCFKCYSRGKKRMKSHCALLDLYTYSRCADC